MKHKDRKQVNYRRSIRLTALLFLVLGCANSWYGDRRTNRYEVLLAGAEKKLSDPNTNKEQQVRYVRQLRNRIGFYSTVENGGRVLVGISILLTVAAFLVPGPVTASVKSASVKPTMLDSQISQ